MKLFFDILPIICFFIAYKYANIFVATGVAMIISLVQVGTYWLLYRRFEGMQVFALLLILVFGSMTLLLHDAMFIKWKVSILYWVLGGALLASHWVGTQPLIQRVFKDTVQLPLAIWYTLNLSWAIFLLLLGTINILVVYFCSTDTWVNFKLFGTIGLTLVFAIGQSIYMAKHIQNK